jgi:hypothetical protein
MNTRTLAKCLVILTMLGLLAACGGGGTPGSSATAITAQPTDQSVVTGTTATFDVVASNANGYQWQRSTDNGTTFIDVNGATTASYSTPVTTLADSGMQYRVVVSGVSNSVTSSAVMLTVTPVTVAPAISVQPAGQTITAGQDASFSVTASGTSLSYQWRRSTDGGANFTDIAGATNATLTLTAVPLADNAHQFRVVVSNSAGSVTSNTALLTVNPAQIIPAFSTQPASQSVIAPNTATFSVVATGTPSPTLQWQLSTNAGGSFTDIVGATGSSYTTPATGAGDNGNQYQVVATNASGTATSTAATLTVNVPVAPGFTTQPANVTITEGQNAQFTVAVSGTPTPTLQWQLSTDGGSNWSNITGETGSTYTAVAPAQANSGRQFRCVASNSEGIVNSNAAVLTVNAAPANKAWQTAERAGAAISGSVYFPRIAFDAQGNAIAIWMHNDAGVARYDLWANRYVAGSGWGTPQVIFTGVGTRVNHPQLGVDANGNALVVWELMDDLYDTLPHIWSISYNTATGWGTAAGIDNDSGAFNSSSPKLAVAANGTAVVVWTQGDSISVVNVLMATGTAATGWGSPTLLATAPIAQIGGLDVALNSQGNGFAIWQRYNGSNFNLTATSIAGGTSVGATQVISANTGTLVNPHVAVNAGGTAVVVWGQLNGSRFEITSNRFVPGTGWGSPTQVNNPSYPVFNQTPDPQIHLDDAGTATALWVESNGASAPKFWNKQSATSWGSPGLISYSNNNYRMAGNGAGQILGARFSGQNLYASPAYLANTADWGAGTLLTSTGNIPMELAMAANGTGLAVWIQPDSGGYTLWASVYR